MTKNGALETARGMAKRFGKTFVVYRCEWWPADEYRILSDTDALTDVGSQIVERCEPPGATPAAGPVEGAFQFHDPD